MVVPLLLKDEWLAALEDLPVWAPSPMRLIVLAPHPDDETLGAGGFIAAQCLDGRDVLVVAVTDGEEERNALARLGLRALSSSDGRGYLASISGAGSVFATIPR